MLQPGWTALMRGAGTLLVRRVMRDALLRDTLRSPEAEDQEVLLSEPSNDVFFLSS